MLLFSRIRLVLDQLKTKRVDEIKNELVPFYLGVGHNQIFSGLERFRLVITDLFSVYLFVMTSNKDTSSSKLNTNIIKFSSIESDHEGLDSALLKYAFNLMTKNRPEQNIINILNNNKVFEVSCSPSNVNSNGGILSMDWKELNSINFVPSETNVGQDFGFQGTFLDSSEIDSELTDPGKALAFFAKQLTMLRHYQGISSSNHEKMVAWMIGAVEVATKSADLAWFVEYNRLDRPVSFTLYFKSDGEFIVSFAE